MREEDEEEEDEDDRRSWVAKPINASTRASALQKQTRQIIFQRGKEGEMMEEKRERKGGKERRNERKTMREDV